MKKKQLLALLLAAIVALCALTGCAAKSMGAAADASYAESTAAQAPAAEPTEVEMNEEAYEEELAFDAVAEAGGEGSQSADAQPTETLADLTAKIIYSASVSIETTAFDEAVSALERQVAAIGGFVESSNISGDTLYNSDGTTEVVNRWAYYTVRIPATQFSAFLQQTDGFGNVISTYRNAQNITSAYTDNEARLSSLNTQHERLLDMLAKSEDVETLIALEQRLADVRYEIEAIERQQRNYDMQIQYSTVDLDLREVEIYTPTAPVKRSFGEKLSSSLSDGWRSFARGMQDLVLGLASALPTLILLAAIAVALVLLIKKRVKARRAKKAAQKQQQTDTTGS